MESKTCSVRIAGRDFTLSTQNSEEKTQRIAAYVDRKINEVTAQTLATREISAVIAALSIAEELLDAQDENTRLLNALYEMKERQKKET